MEKSFWERRRFFEVYGPSPNAQAGIGQSNEVRYACPCCGYPTLGSLGEFEVCYLCDWEDDGQDDADADLVRGGPNHSFSLVEARENFERYLVKYPPELDTRIGGPDSEREKEAKLMIIAAYDQMSEASVGRLDASKWMSNQCDYLVVSQFEFSGRSRFLSRKCLSLNFLAQSAGRV